MQSTSDKQTKVIKQADKIIGNVAVFEDSIHKQFISYTRQH